MTTYNIAFPYTPALVLALDSFGIEILKWLKKVIAQQSFQSENFVSFMCLVEGENEGFEFIEIDDGSVLECSLNESGFDQANNLRSREEILRKPIHSYQRLVASLPHLRWELQKELRGLREHVRMIRAGLDPRQNFNLDILVFADLTDPNSRGIVLPLAFLIQDLLAYEPNSMGHLLLCVTPSRGAEIEEMADLREAQMFAALKELEAAADPVCAGFRQKLAETAGLDESHPLRFPIYLLDDRKEGTLEVKDREELQIIAGNFLLGLLTGDCAQILSDRKGFQEAQEYNAFFSSAGATALVFEHAPLLEACAARLGVEFLEQFLDQQSDAPLALSERLAAGMLADLGDLESWLSILLHGLPGQLVFSGGKISIALEQAAITFENIPPLEWGRIFQDSRNHWEAEEKPAFTELLRMNAGLLGVRLLARLVKNLGRLPGKTLSTGGSLLTASFALHLVEKEIQKQVQRLAPPEESAAQDFEASVQTLERLASHPSSKSSLRTLLAILREETNRWWKGERDTINPLAWIARLVVRWLRLQDQALLEARQSCQANFECMRNAEILSLIDASLKNLSEQFKTPLVQCHEDLDQVSSALVQVLVTLKEQVDNQDFERTSPFRPVLLDRQLVEWAFQRWKPEPGAFQQTLAEDFHLLDAFPEVDAERLLADLLAAGLETYAPVRGLSLVDCLSHVHDFDPDVCLPGLAQGAIPLLRPNFDSLGNHGLAQEHRLVLAGLPWPGTYQAALARHFRNWDVFSGNPQSLVCLRVRHDIPLAALKDLVHTGKRIYERMDSTTRQWLHLFPSWASGPATEKTNGRCGGSVGQS